MKAIHKHLAARLQSKARRPEAVPLATPVKFRPELVEALVTDIASESVRVKFAASKALRTLSERSPELVYPQFDFLVNLLDNPNAILKWNATLTLANLAVVDREFKIDRILNTYLAPIPGPHLIDASNTIRGAAVIALAKPRLGDTISRKILEVERAAYATAECRNVAIGHAIRALEQFCAALPDQHEVQMFVGRQVNNPRLATHRKAMNFLKRFPIKPLPAMLRQKAA